MERMGVMISFDVIIVSKTQVNQRDGACHEDAGFRVFPIPFGRPSFQRKPNFHFSAKAAGVDGAIKINGFAAKSEV